ncbi:MAG: CRISPR-associated helicase Cas3' [Candidatus Babeliaceae bacterium]|nr:CRISPR-associated helicase Cas3' [Candidatus Babeliaceae bacterium]
MTDYFAHSKEGKPPSEWQPLDHHLKNVAELAKNYGEKVGMGNYGELLGLLHDFGKYSAEFQKYLSNATKRNDMDFNPDEDEDFEDITGKKGKIDHSTAGAQYLTQYLNSRITSSNAHKILGQALSICLVSHHSGLINCITTDNKGTWNSYSKRLSKDDEKTHLSECSEVVEKDILNKINEILSSQSFTKPFEEICRDIVLSSSKKGPNSIIAQFNLGLLVRILFSALIDADRQDTADSERPKRKRHRLKGKYNPWQTLIERIEKKHKSFEIKNPVDEIRKEVAEHCLRAAEREKGLFTLTVPTGGGKTLASLLFALRHAKKQAMEHIFYIIPFTTIIDQNAQIVREILEPGDCPEDSGKIVLEHHSNIGSDTQTWKEKLLTENWDSPVIFTTMVQFLEALFGAGTRGARRMHQLARSIIIFDEIQTLPVKCVHLFNNAINFLIDHCGSTVVLCTATQPLLEGVDEKKGSLKLSKHNELMPDVGRMFAELKRVSIHDSRKAKGWTYLEIAKLSFEQVKNEGNCLVVVNTKKAARIIFEEAKNKSFETFHLSTGMCPVHRKKTLNVIRQRLQEGKPILCISTQLIEAGVDIDFRSVVRLLAGLDSIAQAAGRCNRHGSPRIGNVFIVNAAEENLRNLEEIKVAQEKSNRVLDDYSSDASKYDADTIGPKMLQWYYKNYFYDRKDIMDYPVDAGRKDTILNLLSTNSLAVDDYRRRYKTWPEINLRHSFMTAAKLFKSIEAPTQSVIVQYGDEGKNLVGELCAAFEVEKQYSLIKKAQQFSVNLFPHEFERLARQKALYRVQEGTEIYYLDRQYYSRTTGLSFEPIEKEVQFNDEYIA